MYNQVISTTLLVFAFLAVAALTTWLLSKYTSRKLSSWYVLILVWIGTSFFTLRLISKGWYFSFVVVVLIPLDVSSTSHKQCEVNEESCTEPWIDVHRNNLIYIWNTIYWTTYILCWTAYPFIQSYVTDGSFTFGERFKAALRENLIFYGVCLGVVVILFLWMIAKTHGNYQDIYATAIAAANAWGLFLLICLLGFGLVEIPRKIWQESNREKTMKYYQFDIVNKRQDFEDAKIKYYETLKLIRKYSDRTKSNNVFRPYIDTIENECPPEYRQIKEGAGDYDLRYDKLVSIRKRLVTVIHELRRSQGLVE